MTYFRYDNNQCGFDMAGIEWEIYEQPSVDMYRAKGNRFVSAIDTNLNGKYGTAITRNGTRVADLNEMDTARFINAITDDGRDKTGRPNAPRPIKSCTETIEHFLSAGDRV